MSFHFGRAPRQVVAIGLTFVALTGATRAQNLQWTAAGTRYEEGLGWDCATCSDVDGDGFPDLMVSARPNAGYPGKTFVYSSKTANPQLLEFTGDAPDDHFGNQVGDLGDVDGDGVGDYAISAPDRVVTGAPLGAIFVVSGTAGVLRTITSPNGTQLGLAMAAIGDVDGDGVRDLLYNDDFHHFTVVVESGTTGATIRTHTSVRLDFGYALGSLGDVDADGVADYAICDHGLFRGKLRVYSGASGALLFTYPGSPTWVEDAGDADGDGHADVLFCEFGSGVVELVSGATGLQLAAFTRNFELDFGQAGSTIGDFDGDGFADVVLSRIPSSIDPSDPGTELCIFSGATGLELVEYDSGLLFVKALDGSTDFDGDGVHDVVASEPNLGSFSAIEGASGGYHVRYGVTVRASFGDSLAVIGDRDGDGWRDVAVQAPGGLDLASAAVGVVKIVSGQDGHELSRFKPGSKMDAGGGKDLVAVGDLDGDGIDDLAVACPGPAPGGGGPNARVVELRSGANDALLGTIVPPSGSPTGLAAAAEVSGAPLLAVATHTPERLYVYDLVTKTITTQVNGGAGASEVACMGDVDQDGRVDWLVQDLSSGDFGVFTGGPTPVSLWSRSDVKALVLTSVRDLDADGVDDVLAGHPNPTGNLRGKVTVLSGVDGTTLYELVDAAVDTWFGSAVASVGDVDGDGAGDFVVGAPDSDVYVGAIHLYSGRTGSRLYRFEGNAVHDFFGQSLATCRWHEERSLDADAIPDLLTGAPWFDSAAGRAHALRLDDLLLQIDPPIAAASESVTASTRGGPTGNLAGLFAVDLSGTPLSFFLALGSFDSFGSWSVTGTVPAGFSGNTLSLRSYAVGYSGKVVDSQTMTLTFQ